LEKGKKLTARRTLARKKKPSIPAVKRALNPRKTVLEAAAIRRKSTKQKYEAILASFSVFAVLFGTPLTEIAPATAKGGEALDSALCEWADEMYHEGHKSGMGDAIIGALKDWWPQAHCQSHLQLPRFRRARRGWTNLAPGVTRGPLPWLQLMLVIGAMIEAKNVESALICLTLFCTYMRPSEGLAVTVKDLLPPSASSRHWALHLHTPRRGEGIQDRRLGRWDCPGQYQGSVAGQSAPQARCEQEQG